MANSNDTVMWKCACNMLTSWQRGVVVSVVHRMNEVTCVGPG